MRKRKRLLPSFLKLQFLAKCEVSPQILQAPPLGYTPRPPFLEHDDARCPRAEHTKQVAYGRGLAGFSRRLQRESG